MAESEEELKSLLMKVKEESEKLGKAQHSENEDHGIWSHHFIGNRRGKSGNSVRHTTQWANISIHFRMIPMMILVMICHHTKILHNIYYSPHRIFLSCHSFILQVEVCTRGASSWNLGLDLTSAGSWGRRWCHARGKKKDKKNRQCSSMETLSN